jgi:hypothetical protein
MIQEFLRPKIVGERFDQNSIPLDVASRLEELAQLKQGWLDGDGVELSKEGLKAIEADLNFRFSDDKMLPHIFPTLNGGLQFEWSTSDHERTLEVDLITRKGHWTDVNLQTDDIVEREFDLNQDEDWQYLLSQLTVSR